MVSMYVLNNPNMNPSY